MKKHYTFLILIFAIAFGNAQTITIPDANFKAKLLASSATASIAYNSSNVKIKIDSNNDGQIQVSEAQQVYSLYVNSSSIASLTGIESFTNLRGLYCGMNQLTSLNISNLSNLLTLYCNNNQLTALSLNALTGLISLDCTNNQLASLDLTGMVALKYLNCSNNLLVSLNAPGLVNLYAISCNYNYLPSLNLTNLTGLNNLQCAYNQLTSITLSGCTLLDTFQGSNNQLTSFDFTGLNNLYTFDCSYNNLAALDLSVRPNRYIGVNCSYNPNLISINTKDNIIMQEFVPPLPPIGGGTPPPPGQASDINFQGTPNLQYFCLDQEEFAYVQNRVNQAGYTNPNCQLSSTCNFTQITNTTTAAACGSYKWAVNNQIYTVSGMYTVVNGNTLEILNLTITPNTTNTTTVAACESYTWAVNNQTYTASGAYSVVNGCHTEYLNLTIAPNTSNTTAASACGNYTWALNNQTYTASGTYSVVNGCHTEYLNLTITPNTSNTTTVAACGSYTWAVNNQTYTASGTYSVVNGCHTEYLNLTVDTIHITAQPVGPVLCSVAGSTGSISIVSDIVSPTYTWQYRVVTTATADPDWINIDTGDAGAVYSGYTTATLGITKTMALPKVNTQYRVIIHSGICGNVISDEVSLTLMGVVKAGAIAAPASGCIGSDITFSLSGYVGTSIQWQSALNSTASFVTIAGATGSSYTVPNLQPDSDKRYRAIVTNAPCNTTATTAVKTITVNPSAVAGTITGGGIICEDGSGTLKVMGYVGKIQWQYSEDGITYFDVPKASAIPQGLAFSTSSATSTAATYMLAHMTADLFFRAKITSGACTAVYTNAVQYQIQTIASVGTITAANTAICAGSGTTITLSNATGTITWQKSTNYTTATPTWANIANSNSVNLTVNSQSYNTAYRAMVSIGACSTVYSTIAYVALVGKPVAKTISANITSPSGKTAAAALCVTDTSKILTMASGYAGSIEWQVSTTSATSGYVAIPEATAASYIVTNPSIGANYYRARVTNACGAEAYSAVNTLYYKECVLKTKQKEPFTAAAYPNPFDGSVTLSLTTSNEDVVAVSVYDMLGKAIEQRQLLPSGVSGWQLGENYPSGIYNVVITQGSNIKTLRIIKR